MYLQVLGYEKHQQLMQFSWNYMNDSLRTDVFVRYQPETVACACIYLTARKLKLPLPKNPAWYSLFGVTEEDIRDVCVRILKLYTRPKINVDALEKKVEDLVKKYQEAKIKARGGSGNNTPNNNSPSSPSSQKTSGAHNAWGGFISRSGSHIVPSVTEKRSRSRSGTISPVSKHHKRSKKHARSRSRSPRNHKKHKRGSYSRSRSNSPHNKSRKGRDKRRSRSISNEKDLKNDRYIDRYDKNDRYDRDRYVIKEERDRDRYDEKGEKKDRHDKGDKRYEKDREDKYREDKYRDEKYRDDREKYASRDEKEKYKKSKHREEESKNRDRSKDRRR
ncbi:cyclin-L1-like isoform X2 [Agrilus planipennis]|nr:cyclin-L1-like isoform X2 [Agrilus planipennis]XP_025837530.1 cyclin-L1-like isoform X2 [Agrilus planipennis]